MAGEGWPFVLPPLVLGGLGLALGHPVWGGLALLLAALMVLFFRDPERNVAGGDGAFVSPADGRVVRIRETDRGTVEMSIFLAPWNVHINRAPMAGALVEALKVGGGYKPAYKDEASTGNVQTRLLFETAYGPVRMKQIVGMLARRLVLWKRAGDSVARGERIGLMKFGSRVDLELPAAAKIRVREGDMVRGAETIIAEVGA